MNAKERLKGYIERDEIYEDYKKDKLMNPSDFEKFCIQHCRDIEEILEENQELKKHLEVSETCNLKTLEDYKNYYDDTTREQILADTYIEYCAYVNLAHRYSELNKQVETYEIEGYEQNEELNKMSFDIRKYNTQQKEFIKYLEDEIEIGTFLQPALKMILQKYKEIIGNDINVGSKGVKDE